MTLSVGFGKIANDPEATILTRKALGRLATPGLLVTDKGITIDNNGRMVLRLASAAGLSEDSNGLAVKLAPGGGIFSTSDGLAVDGGSSDFGDITVNSITVTTNAIVSGNVTVSGVLTSASANIVGALNALSVSATNAVSSASVSTGAITSSSISNSGTVTTTGATITGNASVGGTLTAGVFNPSSLNVSGNATVGGTLAVTSSFGAATVSIANGTQIIRVLSFFVNCNIGLGAGSPNAPQDFTFSVPGAIFGDGVFCSPLGTPGNNVNGWSAAIIASGFLLIRIAKSGILGATTSMDFRVVIMGFA